MITVAAMFCGSRKIDAERIAEGRIFGAVDFAFPIGTDVVGGALFTCRTTAIRDVDFTMVVFKAKACLACLYNAFAIDTLSGTPACDIETVIVVTAAMFKGICFAGFCIKMIAAITGDRGSRRAYI